MKGPVGAVFFVVALAGPAMADRVDPFLGIWRNPAPSAGDVARLEIASPSYVSAKVHGWGQPDVDWGVNGAVMMGDTLVADYETPTHYIEITLQPPAAGEMVYDLQLRLKSTMRTAGVLHGTLTRAP
ncbi:MAG: hypothetical protein JOZ72_02345 [Alphaproteobacteria bacterium]|nr:hypothetical protein [Alphaproteobacteria bacterium]